jgi:cytochrome bd-type quinol oxidase subunit 2
LLVNFPSPHPGAPACPSTFEMLQTKERAPTHFAYVVFTFGLTVESIKELGVHHSIWILSITLSKLGLGSSSMLFSVIIVLNYSLFPPLISSKQVSSSSSSKSTTNDLKVVLDFFLMVS